jgi:UDP-N-acetylglucosamine 4,6-dehydratase
MTEPFDWTSKTVLITGGTGSFGRRFVDQMLARYRPRRLIVFSRDEVKQHDMRQVHPDVPGAVIRYFIGDVRDADRLRRAMQGVDIVVHAAALKQVPTCEYNPIEAVLTNVMGAKNVIEAALDTRVERVLALSTDKAVSPVNLYGATKLVAEKLFVQANAYSGTGPTRFSCVRYGNVVGSRGSVIPLFLQQRRNGHITVTHPAMTRFWITLDQGVRFVVESLERMHGGEVFVPKLPSTGIAEVVSAIAPHCTVQDIGIRAGEKLHESLIGEDESIHTLELEDRFIVKPPPPWYFGDPWTEGTLLSQGVRYGSDNNPQRLSGAEILQMVEAFDDDSNDGAGAPRRHPRPEHAAAL